MHVQRCDLYIIVSVSQAFVRSPPTTMAGSSRDHERGEHLPDELGEILQSLSERHANILYYALTNNHVRTYFLNQLQTRVVEIAENHTRAARTIEDRGSTPTGVLRKAMPKIRPPPLRSANEVAPCRPPSSSVMWRPNVVNYVVPPPPLPPPTTPPPEDDVPVSRGSNSVKAFCAKASSSSTIADLATGCAPRSILRRRSRSRSRSHSAESDGLHLS